MFLESAFFFPEAIAGRARRYNFTSDASHRFERGVDFDNNVAGHRARDRADPRASAAASPGRPWTRWRSCPSASPSGCGSRARSKVIGIAVPASEMADIFPRLGLAATRSGRGADEAFVVTPPSYRFDIEIEEDLIEEVARVHGFDASRRIRRVVPAVMRARAEGRRSLHDLRAQLAARDYQEVVNFSFVDDAWERDFAGNANADPPAQSDREPARRDAHRR